MTSPSPFQNIPTPLLIFLAPVILSLLLFTAGNLNCTGPKQPVSGEITLFYTSDVGGRLDPCG